MVADAAYTIATTASGVRVGVIGAITETLPSLVTPEVFAQANLTPAVAAINAQAAMLKDGDPANGEADIVVSAFHEDPALNAGIGPQVDVLINGHTHLTVVDRDATGRPVIQPTNYAGGIGRTQLLVDTDDNKVCQVVSNENIVPAVPNGIDRDAYIAAFPRAAAVDTIVRRALAEAGTLGAEVIGEATAPIYEVVFGQARFMRSSAGLVDDVFHVVRREELTLFDASKIGRVSCRERV